jgi:2-C-methyl-D-erythritol 2,4-cyclodiphosphate synthase
MDSILGALALGDIGKHFPDTDMTYKDIDSCVLLGRVYNIMRENGYDIGNIDATIVAQAPKLAPYIDDMRSKISKVLNTNIQNISIKATTTEWLGFEGREEGISASSTCLLKKVIDNN